MSKRNLDGDVLANRLSVQQAKEKKLLGLLSGGLLEPAPEPRDGESREDRDEDDFKDEALGYEQVGVGGKIPKKVQDGSFTQRSLTSSDKLLQQLLGKKAAKAHIAAKQAPKEVKISSSGKPVKPTKAEESEGEEEGRGATFRSKRRKTTKSNKPTEAPDSHDSQDQTPVTEDAVDPTVAEHDLDSTAAVHGSVEDEPPTSQTKSKSGSYLDQILAERSKKKKKKQKNKEGPQSETH